MRNKIKILIKKIWRGIKELPEALINTESMK